MSENNFQTRVIKYIEQHGGYSLNVPGGTQIPKGTPDLLVCWRGNFLGLELKTDIGKLSPLQIDNIETINNAGGYARQLRPYQWNDFKTELWNMPPVIRKL